MKKYGKKKGNKPKKAKGYQKRGNKSAKSHGISKPWLILFKQPKGNHNPFPPRYQTTFTLMADYTLTNVLYTDSMVFCKMNSMVTPVNLANQGTGAITFVGPATKATLQPTGFTTLCNAVGPYTSFRCFGSRIEIDYRTQTTDVMQIVIAPVKDITARTVFQLMSQPYCVSGHCGQGFNSGDMTNKGIKNFIPTRKFFGFTKAAIEADASAHFSGTTVADPTSICYWAIALSSADGVANTSGASMTVKVTYYCELFYAIQQTLAET